MENQTQSEKNRNEIFMKYEYLAARYAHKIFSYEQISFEYEDLLQEFRLKILTTIEAYGRRWKKHIEEGYAKPVPIQKYIESALVNKCKDFMKYITDENHKVRIDDIDFDLGTIQDTTIDTSSNKFVVNGIDLLENLTGKHRVLFSMHLRGYNNKILDKVINNKNKVNEDIFTPDDVIEIQKEYLLENYSHQLFTEKEIYYSYSVSEE